MNCGGGKVCKSTFHTYVDICNVYICEDWTDLPCYLERCWTKQTFDTECTVWTCKQQELSGAAIAAIVIGVAFGMVLVGMIIKKYSDYVHAGCVYGGAALMGCTESITGILGYCFQGILASRCFECFQRGAVAFAEAIAFIVGRCCLCLFGCCTHCLAHLIICAHSLARRFGCEAEQLDGGHQIVEEAELNPIVREPPRNYQHQ